MKYFVKLEMIGTPPADPLELIQHLEQMVIPHFELFMKLEAEKKILASGTCTGAREGVFIFDVDSHDELDKLLISIPGWNNFKIEVTPLQNHEDRIKTARQFLEHLKSQR